jgi:hypothetical protein
VLAEAMACGVPIVGSRSGSLTEVVEEKETGLLAPPRRSETRSSSSHGTGGCERIWDIGLSSVSGRTSRSTVMPRARSRRMRYCEASPEKG